jgi:hypothetical protein
MIPERRTERITLSVSPAFEAYLESLFETDENPRANYASHPRTVAEYAYRRLEECTGYSEKRVAQHLDGLGAQAISRMEFTTEDREFLGAQGTAGDL